MDSRTKDLVSTGSACLLLLAALLACGVSSSVVYLPNGQVGYNITCNGTAHTYADCMNEAASVCHGPYIIVNADGSVVQYSYANQYGGQSLPIVKRNMIIVCDSSQPATQAPSSQVRLQPEGYTCTHSSECEGTLVCNNYVCSH